MVPVGRRNLTAEKGRLAISIAGVAFAVILILVVLSMYRGWSGVGGIIEEVPADLWVVQQGTTDPFHSVSLLDEDLAPELAKEDGVRTVSRAFARTMSAEVGGKSEPVFLMSLERPKGEDTKRRIFFPPSGTASVDRAFAKKHGVTEGDTLRLNNRDIQVGRIYSGGNVVMFQFVFVAAEDAREIFGVPGTVNYFLLGLDDGVAPETVAPTIDAAYPQVDTFTGPEFAAAIRREVKESFLPVVGVLVIIGFIIGVAVIGLTTYTATVEKSRDFGVMKAIGASGGFLYRIVVVQSILVGVAGFVLGLAAAVLVSLFAEEAVPEFVTEFRWSDAVGVLAAALVMAMLASFLPAARVDRIDPALVFRA
jgi:putative ABC transport system permease protein